MLNFRAQIKREFDNKVSEISAAVTKAGLAGWKAAVSATPVDTGRLRAGWRISTQRRSSYVPTAGRKPPPSTPNFKFRASRDNNVYIFNNVPYATYVENGEGRGSRTSRPMLAKAVAEFNSTLESLLRSVR